MLSRRAPPRLSKRAGLTLVELLLAISLFTVVLAAAGSLMILGLRIHQGAPVDRRPALRFEQAMLRLEQDLDAAQPLAGTPALVESNRVEFAAVARVVKDGEARTGWCRIRYAVRADADQHTVLVREQLDLEDRVIAQEALLPVAAAAFSYAVTDGQQLAWRDAEWPAETEDVPHVPQIPRLIRLTGRLAGPEAISIERVLRLPDGVVPVVQP